MTGKARFNPMSKVHRLQDEDGDYSTDDRSMGDYSNGTGSEAEADHSTGENDGSGSNTRGPNRGNNGDNSGLIPLEFADNRFITPSASRAVTASLKANLGGPYPTFKSLLPETKTLLWEKFTTQYSWPTNDENEEKRAWTIACISRHGDIFFNARKEAKAKSRSQNPLAWKGFGPQWLSPEHWNEIIDSKWNKDDWKKKSKSGRDNRLTLKSGTITKHTGGSITFAAHKRRLEKLLGKPPSASQYFKRVHRKKKGEGDFVDNKSRIVCENYESSIVEKHGPDESTQPALDVEAWCEASQGPSKGGVLYGLGVKHPADNKLGSSSTPLENNDEIATLTEKIDELTRDNEELVRRMEERAQEEERKRRTFEDNVRRMLNGSGSEV